MDFGESCDLTVFVRDIWQGQTLTRSLIEIICIVMYGTLNLCTHLCNSNGFRVEDVRYRGEWWDGQNQSMWALQQLHSSSAFISCIHLFSCIHQLHSWTSHSSLNGVILHNCDLSEMQSVLSVLVCCGWAFIKANGVHIYMSIHRYIYSGTSPKDHLHIKTSSISRPLYSVPKFSPLNTMLNWFRIPLFSELRPPNLVPNGLKPQNWDHSGGQRSKSCARSGWCQYV